MRLLVIKDEPDLAQALAKGLRRQGYAVNIASVLLIQVFYGIEPL